MNSSEVIKKLLVLLDAFSKKLPDGLLKVNNDNEDKTFSSHKNLCENIHQLSQDLKELSQQTIVDQKSVLDLDNVQITVTKAQLDQRINAFISHVQNAVDQQNIHEFFPTIPAEKQDGGCARANAVYRRRPTRGTHVQVNRVQNKDGPQTQINSQGRWRAVKRENTAETFEYPESVRERLANLEDHLRINKSTVPKDVYERLKLLEDKVLELESISPEYFHDRLDHRHFRETPSENNENQPMTIDQIDDRIHFLKNKLMSKKRKIG